MFAAAVAGVLVGAAIVASRFVVAQVPPLTLAMLRYAVGFLCLLPFAWSALTARSAQARPQPSVGRSRSLDLLAMAALGIGQFGVLIALLNYGLQRVGAAQAAMLFSLFPLLTLLLAAALGREQVTPSLVLGVLLSLAGVGLALVPKLGAGPEDGGWWGEAAIVAAAGTGALCSVLYRPYLQRYPTVPVSAFAMLASVAVLAVMALAEGWPARVMALGGTAWAVVGFIGFSSGLGYFLWLYALKHESPTRVTVFLALNPVTAALLGAWLLHEPFTPWAGAALTFVAAGLWLATRPLPPAQR